MDESVSAGGNVLVSGWGCVRESGRAATDSKRQRLAGHMDTWAHGRSRRLAVGDEAAKGLYEGKPPREERNERSVSGRVGGGSPPSLRRTTDRPTLAHAHTHIHTLERSVTGPPITLITVCPPLARSVNRDSVRPTDRPSYLPTYLLMIIPQQEAAYDGRADV
eukprot:GHVU01232024.1.p1 GENE.GHVU01232024.1~~GHVU01232024.1.p1  ORF type:complete len:163 (+),score=10.16 GHVU01232024.1:107-595(+)